MNTTHGQKEKGFTIIEVVLVLAIAALIMLMVFLALPALQRGQRDNARKNDVGIVGSAVTAFKSNKNGNPPSNGKIDGASDLSTYVGDLGQYTKANIVVSASGGSGAPVAAVGNTDDVKIVKGARCNPDGSATGVGSDRQVAALYALEANGSGTASPICQAI